jgi:nucleotide-binding universal stress UspA family protein
MIPFRTILFAADFSESSRGAFQVACALAREHSTRVIILNVLQPMYVPESPVHFGQQSVRYLTIARAPSEHESRKRHLRELYVPDHPLDVDYQTKEGEIAGEILSSSEKMGCDLIVMGTHGRHGINRLLAGSIAETVLRKAPCPVLALRRQAAPWRGEPIRVILHPTDFSDCSEASLHVARLLARDVGARLVLLHVTPLDMVAEGALAGGGDLEADADCLEAIRERMEGPDLKCPVETRLKRGDPTAEILRVASQVEANLIVMGTHGRSGLGRVLMGSVAEAVLRGARCPVLIARSPLPKPEAARRKPTTISAYVL